MDELPSSELPKRTLAIKARTSPPKEGEYFDTPNASVLDQLMLHYLGMEEILKLYQRDHRVFEVQSSLDILANRFVLYHATTFKELLRDYDATYATVRSYHYKRAKPRKIALKAAEEGNIQAFYDGLKLHKKLRHLKFYNRALRHAGIGGHREIIELLFELGANSYMKLLSGLTQGGHMKLFMQYLSEARADLLEDNSYSLIFIAVEHKQLEILKYLIEATDTEDLGDSLSWTAARSGDVEIIDYLGSKGLIDYDTLLREALRNGKLQLVKAYYNMPGVNVEELILSSIKENQMRALKFLLRKTKPDVATLNLYLAGAGRDDKLSIVKYLIKLGANDYESLLQEAASHSRLDVIKKYYSLSVNLVAVFYRALEGYSLKIVKFLADKTELTEAILNVGLNLAVKSYEIFNSYEMVKYLISLGATDYDGLIRNAITHKSLQVIEKYYHKSSISLEEAFLLAASQDIDTFKLIAKQGTVSQDVLNQAFNDVNTQYYVRKALSKMGAVSNSANRARESSSSDSYSQDDI